jgi:tRNA (guanine-N7-)-methyltransferase
LRGNLFAMSIVNIRSFVRREGRLTNGQKSALKTLWPIFGVDNNTSIDDLDSLFGRPAPKVLEIGFGMGDSLAAMAQSNSDIDYLGIEIHRPGIGHLLSLANKTNITNLRIINQDAVDALQTIIPDQSFDTIQIFFPDPWPKKRHHKRRLIQPEFSDKLIKKLKFGGKLHLATDWEDYAQHMLSVLNKFHQISNASRQGTFIERPPSRPITKFERRGTNLGHNVWDLLYVKNH